MVFLFRTNYFTVLFLIAIAIAIANPSLPNTPIQRFQSIPNSPKIPKITFPAHTIFPVKNKMHSPAKPSRYRNKLVSQPPSYTPALDEAHRPRLATSSKKPSRNDLSTGLLPVPFELLTFPRFLSTANFSVGPAEPALA